MERYKAETEKDTGWKGLFVVHDDKFSQLCWGRYNSRSNAEKNLRKATQYRTAQRNSPSRNTSAKTPPAKKRTKQKEPEVEKTAVEKNYDKYNANRYRDYINHLSRLQRGQPTAWSGAIPKRPEKKKK